MGQIDPVQASFITAKPAAIDKKTTNVPWETLEIKRGIFLPFVSLIQFYDLETAQSKVKLGKWDTLWSVPKGIQRYLGYWEVLEGIEKVLLTRLKMLFSAWPRELFHIYTIASVTFQK